MSFELPFELPLEWQALTVEELVKQEIIAKPLDGNHGGTHPKSSDYIESGVPFVMASDLLGGRVDLDTCKFISNQQALKLRKGFSKVGDVLLSHKATIGRTAIVQENDNDFIMLTPQVTYYRVLDKEKLSNIYLKAYFDSHFFQTILALWAGAGSTRAYLGITGQLKLPIILPPIDIQNKISKQVSALNNKIIINSQTNQTLEEMAQAIFKSWFVDFDPVKAKMRGEQPEGMDAATAALFPDKLVESELGFIPEGWEINNIEDIVQRLKPKKRYTKKQVMPYGKTPVYEQGASILLGFHDDDAGFGASPEEPIFIFGDHTCITHLSCSKFDISSNVIPLKGRVRPTIWTYYAIQGKQEFQEYRRHWSEFIVKKVILPSDDLTKKYANLVTKMYLMVESLKRQSKELELLRDTLLPKLLSGEIEITNEELADES